MIFLEAQDRLSAGCLNIMEANECKIIRVEW